MSKEIRIINGRKVSTKGEVARLNSMPNRIFIGNSSNYPAYANEKDLYDKKVEVFAQQPVFIDPQDFNRLNIYVGGMGSGKSVSGNLIIDSFPESHMLINDPKRERVGWAYDADKDIIICSADQRGACIDIFGDLKKKRILINEVFKSMEKAQRGAGSQANAEWAEFMMDPVNLICDKIFQAMDDGVPTNELYVSIAIAYAEVEADYKAQKSKMLESALKVCTPIFNALFAQYYIGSVENRKWISILDLAKYRRVFILGHPNYKSTLKPINNFFLTMCALDAMAADDVPDDEVAENLSFWIFEEFLSSIDLDDELLTELMSQCRSKAISMHVFVQTMDKDTSEKLNKLRSLIKTSRYLSLFFQTGDDKSAQEIAESSGGLNYEKRQDIANTKMFDFLGGDTESWSPVNSHSVSTHMMMNMPNHVAYMQVNDRRIGTIKSFLKAPYVKRNFKEPSFIESEVALNVPPLNVFIARLKNGTGGGEDKYITKPDANQTLIVEIGDPSSRYRGKAKKDKESGIPGEVTTGSPQVVHVGKKSGKKSKKGKLSRQKQQILFTALAAAVGWVVGVALSLNVLFLLSLVCLSAWAVYVAYAVTGQESSTENAQVISKDLQADVDRWFGKDIRDPRLKES